MAITVGGTSITFNDATTQNTAGLTSAVTSVATGNGLSGGTITTTGTLTIAAPSFNSVGSYCFGVVRRSGASTTNYDSNVSAGTGDGQIQVANAEILYYPCASGYLLQTSSGTNVLSGTWKIMNKVTGSGSLGNSYVPCVAVRVS